MVTETPLFWKRFPEPSKHPSARIRIKKNVWFQKFLDSCGRGLISSFTSLGSRLFIGDDFRWRNLWEIPHAYRGEKNYYYWTTGSSVRQDMNNVTVLKFQALCYWFATFPLFLDKNLITVIIPSRLVTLHFSSSSWWGYINSVSPISSQSGSRFVQNLLVAYPGYQRFFLACDGELRFVGRRPTRVRLKAEDWPLPETAHEKPLAPRVLVVLFNCFTLIVRTIRLPTPWQNLSG